MTSLFAVVANCLPEPTRVRFMTFLATSIAGLRLGGAARRGDLSDGQLGTLHLLRVSLRRFHALCDFHCFR